jgi:hypothetical protein
VSVVQTNIPCELFKTSVTNHSIIKEKILGAIKSMGSFSFIDNHQSISNTDWHLSQSVNRPYVEFIIDIFDEHNKKFIKEFNYTKYSILNFWFQQYKKGDFHPMHAHGNASYSCVYYVELSEDNPKTTFVQRNKEYTFDVKEGDILTFPSCLLHSSPPNKSDKVKTIISFNLNAE